jgi:16S rRNA (guanine966-N2)-methyltransferase
VRETLFNWLAPSIGGATCLDLFAGTGVLGLEALSRGAADVVFVEQDRRLVRSLRSQLAALESVATVIDRDAMRYLHGEPSEAFDIVFLDPPYSTALSPIVAALVRWLNDRATIYVERPRSDASLGAVIEPAPGMRIAKEACAGDVLYGLLEFERA